MIYIEDVIISLSIFSSTNRVCKVHSFDLKIVDSLAEQTFRGVGYTEKQCDLALKIVNRYATRLVEHYNLQSIKDITETPDYKLPIRKSVVNKQISVVDVPHALGVPRSIRAQFPFDQALVDEIRLNRKTIGNPVWDPESTSWMFALTEQSILFLSTLQKRSGFEADAEFSEYATYVDSICKNSDSISEIVPIVAYENGHYIYKNAHPSVPPLSSDQLLPALFEARERGITVWDDIVSSQLKKSQADPITRMMLESSEDHFHINSLENPVQCLTHIVQYLQPALFIIPGGSELKTLKQIHAFLLESGVESSEISVQFRLPKASGADFNEYVRENQLNSPVTSNTRAVIISVTLPKPLIKSKIDFKVVISFGRNPTHYVTRNFVNNHRNVIYYYPKGQMF
jgi:hypothetical protein